TLRGAFQALAMKAVVRGTPRPLVWRVDGRPVGSAISDEHVEWPLTRGAHRISVSDDRGLSDETDILVR
ncbi:MAG: hypothetical protein M3R62_09085, partial [Acidobacteriota bacterium]|nr:hypothetical protein [Acidobacteriota bacterium]